VAEPEFGVKSEKVMTKFVHPHADSVDKDENKRSATGARLARRKTVRLTSVCPSRAWGRGRECWSSRGGRGVGPSGLYADIFLPVLTPLYGMLDEEGQGRSCLAEAHIIDEQPASYHGFDNSSSCHK